MNQFSGAALRERRQKLDLTQEELGKHLSVSGNTIARLEREELIPEHPGMLWLALEGLEARLRPWGLSKEAQQEIRETRRRISESGVRTREILDRLVKGS